MILIDTVCFGGASTFNVAIPVINRHEIQRSNRIRTWCDQVFRDMGSTLFPGGDVLVSTHRNDSQAIATQCRRSAFAITHPDSGAVMIWRSPASTAGHIGLHAQLARELGRRGQLQGWCLTDPETTLTDEFPVVIRFETDRMVLFEIECWANVPGESVETGEDWLACSERSRLQGYCSSTTIFLGMTYQISGMTLRSESETHWVSLSRDQELIRITASREGSMEHEASRLTLDLGDLAMTIDDLAALRQGEALTIARPDGAIATVRLSGVAVAAGVIETNADATLTIRITDIFSGRRNFSVRKPNLGGSPIAEEHNE